MASGGFVAYYRVSTDKQGRSGLSLQAQRQAVATYLNGSRCRILAEYNLRFVDDEVGVDERVQRPIECEHCRSF